MPSAAHLMYSWILDFSIRLRIPSILLSVIEIIKSWQGSKLSFIAYYVISYFFSNEKMDTEIWMDTGIWSWFQLVWQERRDSGSIETITESRSDSCYIDLYTYSPQLTTTMTTSIAKQGSCKISGIQFDFFCCSC